MTTPWNDFMLPQASGGTYNPVASFTPSSISGVGAAPAGSLPGSGAGVIPGTGDSGMGFGMNMGTGRLALGAIGAGANLWQAWNANQLAQKTFNFQRDVMSTNLTNSIRSYNTQLEDRARARTVTEGQSDAERQAYVDRNRLTR
jgi:hypothetical protein